MNFFSVAADGKINNWVVMQNELAVTTIITLFLLKEPVLGPDGIHLKMKGMKKMNFQQNGYFEYILFQVPRLVLFFIRNNHIFIWLEQKKV